MLSVRADHAVYTPAISAEFAKIGHAQHLKRSYSFTETDLNFLDPKSKLFHYPFALYSAGQAAKHDSTAKQTSTVSARDRSKTTIVGDSGGYQILTKTIRFEGDKTCERMLRWLEGHADFSMTLDVPTGGIDSGNVAEHTERLVAAGHDLAALSRANGLPVDYNACLLQSQLNLDFFVANRTPGATRLLNVIQGRTERESKTWYEGVKGYNLEGWAFAGTHQAAFSMSVARLLDVIEDGLLPNTPWIHFLGISRLEPAYLFTTILRCLRAANPDIGVSFDTSSPFKTAANFNFFTSYRFDKFGCGFQTPSFAGLASVSDNRTLNELVRATVSPIKIRQADLPEMTFTPLPVATAVGSKVTVAELCKIEDGELKITTDGVWILMNHNVEAYNQAFAALNRSFDSNPLHDDVPVSVRAAKVAIELIFEQAIVKEDIAKARSILNECRHTLDVFA